MAFFENLGRKASETTAKAMQKAQELSEISKLNGQIADEEKRLNVLYYQIGKLYVSVHGSDNEQDFSGMVSAVFEGEKKILNYKKQIQDLKGVQRCEHCGAEVPKGAAFCNACGSPMPKAESATANDLVRCESCGAMVQRGMRFCTSCGKPMNLPSASVDSTTETKSAPAEKVCPNCGAKIEGDADFCTECGTKL